MKSDKDRAMSIQMNGRGLPETLNQIVMSY